MLSDKELEIVIERAETYPPRTPSTDWGYGPMRGSAVDGLDGFTKEDLHEYG